ncbi:MAG: hypothetical protein WA421_05680 [Nitrososphaeraceae archaeon]
MVSGYGNIVTTCLQQIAKIETSDDQQKHSSISSFFQPVVCITNLPFLGTIISIDLSENIVSSSSTSFKIHLRMV